MRAGCPEPRQGPSRNCPESILPPTEPVQKINNSYRHLMTIPRVCRARVLARGLVHGLISSLSRQGLGGRLYHPLTQMRKPTPHVINPSKVTCTEGAELGSNPRTPSAGPFSHAVPPCPAPVPDPGPRGKADSPPARGRTDQLPASGLMREGAQRGTDGLLPAWPTIPPEG